jgi:hypothetical protein
MAADPLRPACMGGWCERRGWCQRYRQDDRAEPVQRICRGRLDAFTPLDHVPLPLIAGTFRIAPHFPPLEA